MKTSWIELLKIERYLLKQDAPEEHLLLEAHIQLDTTLASKVRAQKQVYELVKRHGRDLLREEMMQVEQELLTNPQYKSFQFKIFSIFKK